MARALVLILATVAMAIACGGGSASPGAKGSPASSATPSKPQETTATKRAHTSPTTDVATARRRQEDALLQCSNEAPTAELSYEGQVQEDTRVALEWTSADCTVQSHPDITLPLPREPLRIPHGATAQLSFSATPSAVSAYAWTPSYALTEEDSLGKLQVSFDDLRVSTRKDLAMEPLADQQLALDALPPGDYAIEVSASWPEGSTGYAFRVKVEGTAP